MQLGSFHSQVSFDDDSFENIITEDFSSNKESYLGVHSTSVNSESERKVSPKRPNLDHLDFKKHIEGLITEKMDFLEYEDYENSGDLLLRRSIRNDTIFLKTSDHFEKLAFSFVFVFDLKIKEAEENFHNLKSMINY